MYKAINDNVIVLRDYRERTTESGILLTATSEGQVLDVKVVATNDITEDLQDKIILVLRHKVMQLNESEAVVYGSVNYKDILAVKE
jgi:co-chaperonin GroES (HSP10)